MCIGITAIENDVLNNIKDQAYNYWQKALASP